MRLTGSHLLSVDQFSHVDEVVKICELAVRLEVIVQRKKVSRVLEGAILANLFFEPSTRTRLSFGCAFNLLGGAVRDTTGAASSSLSKGESLEDTGRCVSGYADVIVVRHPEEGSVAQLASTSRVPVINAGDGIGEHPTQALLDAYTILRETQKKKVSLQQLHITLLGDLKHGRTVHSLSKLLSLFGQIHFTFVAPAALQIPSEIEKILLERGCTVQKTDSLKTAVASADVVYVTRIQEERFIEREEFLQYAGQYSIDQDFYVQYCLNQPLLMHPLPRDSRLLSPEIHQNLNHHPNLAIFRQSDNGVAIRMALFCSILGVENEVLKNLTDVKWQVGIA